MHSPSLEFSSSQKMNNSPYARCCLGSNGLQMAVVFQSEVQEKRCDIYNFPCLSPRLAKKSPRALGLNKAIISNGLHPHFLRVFFFFFFI